MRNYNWLLLAISVAVHLAVIAGLQINVASSTPVQSSIFLQLHPPVAKAKPPEPKPQAIPAPQPAVKRQASKKPASAIPVSKPVAIPNVQVITVEAGSIEIPSSTAGLVALQEPKPMEKLVPKLQPAPALPPSPEPTQPPPTPSPAPIVDIAGLLRTYAGGVKREILAVQSYPEAAERLGHEGIVQVGFTIAADGGLASVHVKSSSGFDTIDNAAISAVQAAAPFKAIPKEAQRDGLSMSISLRFYLE